MKSASTCRFTYVLWNKLVNSAAMLICDFLSMSRKGENRGNVSVVKRDYNHLEWIGNTLHYPHKAFSLSKIKRSNSICDC